MFKERILGSWPLLIALLTLWVLVGWCLHSSLDNTNGHLAYTLDDAYIHMAMAKNLAQSGVYGVTKFEFSSSSSSPLWTILLASVYFVFGVREWLPLFLNLLLASSTLILLDKLLRSVSSNQIFLAITLIAVVLFTPFPALIFTGMEHLLHILLIVVFLWFLARTIIEKECINGAVQFLKLSVLVVGVTMARFESYAILALACFFLMLRGRWKLSLGIALAGIIPLLLYQYISVSKGWFWLPNSILIRTDISRIDVFNSQQAFIFSSTAIGMSGFFANFLRNFTYASHVFILILWASILLAVGWIRMKSLWNLRNILLMQYIAIALIHMQFAKCGHFFRYEAYLVTLGLFVIAYALAEQSTQMKWKPITWKKIVLGFVVLVILSVGIIPLQYRCRISNTMIPRACRNIYEQQYQMGLFLKNFYQETPVAANDIGAVAFLGDVHLLDLVGLASVDVLKLKTKGEYTTQQIYQLSRDKNIAIALVYDTWFWLEDLKGVPSQWIKVGEWKIHDNVVCGGNVVSLYAVHASEKERLIYNLRLFSYMLPISVGQFGLYTTINDSSNTLTEPW